MFHVLFDLSIGSPSSPEYIKECSLFYSNIEPTLSYRASCLRLCVETAGYSVPDNFDNLDLQHQVMKTRSPTNIVIQSSSEYLQYQMMHQIEKICFSSDLMINLLKSTRERYNECSTAHTCFTRPVINNEVCEWDTFA